MNRKNNNCILIGCLTSLGNEQTFRDFCEYQTDDIIGNFFYSSILYDIANISSYLRQYGLTTDFIIDYHREKQTLQNKVAAGTNVIAILSQHVESVWQYKDFIKFAKSVDPSVKVAIGGSFIKNLLKKVNKQETEFLLKSIGADIYLNRYECIAELKEYIQSVVEETQYPEIPQSFFIDNKQVHFCDKQSDGIYTDEYPIDWNVYKKRIGQIMSLRTTINCDFNCSFCAIKDDSETFLEIPIHCIKEKMDGLRKLGNVECISFADETVNYPVARFHELLNMMVEQQYPFDWYGFFRCQYIDSDTAKLVKESNCLAAILGLETASNRILKEMNKNVTTDELKKGHSLLIENGVYTIGLFIVGFPGEDEESIQETIDFINETKPTFYILNAWTCEVGTKIWERREEFQLTLLNGKWKHKSMDSDIVQHIITEMQKKITNSICANKVDLSYIIRMLRAGYGLSRIGRLLQNYREHILQEK